MCYGLHFSANQLSGPKKLWDIGKIGEYGLPRLWVKRELTVLTKILLSSTFPSMNCPFHLLFSSSSCFHAVFFFRFRVFQLI